MARKSIGPGGRFLSEDPYDYFNRKIKKNNETGCWNWRGTLFHKGYGQFKNKSINKGVQLSASRASWILFVDKNIGRYDFVCHKCDNRRCANPDHLFIGSQKDNMKDCSDKGRINHGEERPQSKLTESEVVEIRKLRQNGMGWGELAYKFNVAKNCVRSAALGKTWSHVPEPIPTYIGKSGNPRKTRPKSHEP